MEPVSGQPLIAETEDHGAVSRNCAQITRRHAYDGQLHE